MLGIDKRGTLRFWGDWFGRPYDNVHTVIKNELAENHCILYFDHGEVCTIIDPIEIISTSTDFYITDASSVQWEWYLYGEPKLDKYKRVIIYERKSEDTVLKNGSSYVNISINPKGFCALEIV